MQDSYERLLHEIETKSLNVIFIELVIYHSVRLHMQYLKKMTPGIDFTYLMHILKNIPSFPLR